MDHLFANLSEEKIHKLIKKDPDALFELQKQVHLEKEQSYKKLKTLYWASSFTFTVLLFLILVRISLSGIGYLFIALCGSLVLSLVGGKLYLIDKPRITHKAVAKSKHLDAMEIELIPKKDEQKKKYGLGLICASGIIYVLILIMLILK